MTDSDKTEQLAIRLSAAEVAMIDDLRRAEVDIPVRAEMVRRAIRDCHARMVGAQGKKDRRRGA